MSFQKINRRHGLCSSILLYTFKTVPISAPMKPLFSRGPIMRQNHELLRGQAPPVEKVPFRGINIRSDMLIWLSNFFLPPN